MADVELSYRIIDSDDDSDTDSLDLDVEPCVHRQISTLYFQVIMWLLAYINTNI